MAAVAAALQALFKEDYGTVEPGAKVIMGIGTPCHWSHSGGEGTEPRIAHFFSCPLSSLPGCADPLDL